MSTRYKEALDAIAPNNWGTISSLDRELVIAALKEAQQEAEDLALIEDAIRVGTVSIAKVALRIMHRMSQHGDDITEAIHTVAAWCRKALDK